MSDEVKEEVSKTKKKPGRPRKTPARDPPPRDGVSDGPQSPKNFIEFAYSEPIVLKRLWHHFKHLAVEKLHVIFRPDSIVMWGWDHLKKSRIRVKIDAHKVNHYFLGGDEVDVGIECKDMELLMQKINKTYEEVVILSKRGRTQETLSVTLKTEIKIDEVHSIRLAGAYDRMNNEKMFLDEDYTIKIEFPGGYFKKMITNMMKLTTKVTIKQNAPGKELIFAYDASNRRMSSRNIVRNAANLEFQSKLAEGDVFRVSFRVAYVKPIAAAVSSGTVTLCAHEDKPLLFIIKMDDGTVEMRILTDIIDNRPKEECDEGDQ
jgi:hypothetical protein